MSHVQYLEFSGQLNIGVSDFLKPANELHAMKNCYEYRIGKLQKTPGYIVATDSGQLVNAKSINALYHYHYSAGNSGAGVDYMIGGSDSSTDYILEYRTTGAWTTLSATYSTAAGAEICIETYLDKAFIVGHDSGTFLANATLTGTTYTTNTTSDANLLNMPQGKYICEYQDLLYVGNCYVSSTKYPSRVYYCDEPTAGAITWTVATKFLEFGQQDGDEITGLASAFKRLIVFKHFSCWKWDESNKDKIADVGCDSYRSIVNMYGVLYWFNRDGIWRMDGGLPQLVSSKVEPFIDAIDQTALGNVIGVKYKHEYRLFIGNVTVDGITYTNAWICFDVRRERFYIRCTYNTCKSACVYVESSKSRTYFGNDNGYVFKFFNEVDTDTGKYSDNGNEIDSFFITNVLDAGDPSVVVNSPKMTVYTKNCQGMFMAIDADGSGTFQEDRGQVLQKSVQELDINSSAYRYQFKFFEKSSNQSWEFEGFTIENNLKEGEV